MVRTNCLNCNKEFKFYPSTSKGMYCSNSCSNKVTSTFRHQNKPFGFKKGNHPKSEFKKNDIRITGKNNHGWKGNKVGLVALHDWIRVRLAKPLGCNFCGKIKTLDLANKSHKYKRKLDDWLWLCKSCHMIYDKVGYKSWNTRRLKYGVSGRRVIVRSPEVI